MKITTALAVLAATSFLATGAFAQTMQPIPNPPEHHHAKHHHHAHHAHHAKGDKKGGDKMGGEKKDGGQPK